MTKLLAGRRSGIVRIFPETDKSTMLPNTTPRVNRGRAEVGKKVNTMAERNKVASPTSNPGSDTSPRNKNPRWPAKKKFQQGGTMSLEEFKNIQKKVHPDNSVGIGDVLNAPQKAAMYGITSLTRGVGNGVYDTPGNIMGKDWNRFNNKATRTIADVTLDPLNALPAATFNKTISGMKASILPFIKNMSQQSGKLYNRLNNTVDVINLGENAINLYK